ncbi:MAG: AsmA family protein [Alphaproteobacteria bacterium]|nr:AsmA family protein [Alphaproteobacteria bacterium]
MLALAGLLTVAILALYFMDWNRMRGPISHYLSYRFGRQVRINGDLSVDLFRLQPRIRARSVEVRNPGWMAPGAPPAGRFADIRLEMRLLPLLVGRLVLPLVQLDRADVLLVRQASGRSNWDRAGGGGPLKMPPIRRFQIRDGHVEIHDRVRRLDFAGTVNSHERGGRRAAFVLTGDGTLNKGPFKADMRGGPLLKVDENKPYAFSADIVAGKTHARISGAIDHPFHLDHYRADLKLSGANLADVYYLTGLTLPGTPPYHLDVTVRRDGLVYKLTDLNGQVGGSDLAGNLSIDVSGKVPALAGRLASRRLDFVDLGALFGGGPAKAQGAHLLPDTPLHTERLRQTNAEVDFSAARVASRDFPLTSLDTHISLEDGVLDLKPLSFGMTQGRLSGTLMIDARRAVPVTAMDARIFGVTVGNFINGREKPLEGELAARARLTGRGDSVYQTAASADGTFTAVIPRGQIRRSLAEWLGVDVISALGLTLSGDESSTTVRCAVAHFGAKDGVLASQRFIFDTAPVLVEGGGTIDMRRETMKLRMQGKPKHFQLLRVRAPVTVSGRWDRPSVGVDAGPALGQGGIAAALALLNPLASVLAFVDPGLAEDANCGPLVRQARAEEAYPGKRD